MTEEHCLVYGLMCHHICFMDVSAPVFVLRLCKPFFFFLPASDVHRQVNVWIVTCLVMLRVCLAVIMTGNNPNHHFHSSIKSAALDA